MKKYLSMILAVAIAAMLSISVFAALEVPADQKVDVTLGLDGEVIHVYSIDIEFTGTSMTFTYDKGGMEWVIDEGKGYSYDMTDTGWTDADQPLTIINHSDLPLDFTVTMEKAIKYNALTFTLDDGDTASGSLVACTVGTTYGSVKETVEIKVDGKIPHDAVAGEKLGQLIVKFKAVP